VVRARQGVGRIRIAPVCRAILCNSVKMRVLAGGLGALALLGLLLAALIFGVGQVVHKAFNGVNPTVAAASVTAMATIIGAIITLLVGRYFERRKTIEDDIRSKMIPLYSALVKGFLAVFNAGQDGQAQTAQEFFEEVTPDLLTWASDDVLLEWSRFKRSIGKVPDDEVPFLFEKLLVAIRRDYGHSGKNVTEGDILGLFITDIDEAIANRTAKAVE
jgi:hypothetical protein